jgi:excisionase family DNA binding protein
VAGRRIIITKATSRLWTTHIPRDGSFQNINRLEIHSETYYLKSVETDLALLDVCKLLEITRPTVYAMLRRGEINGKKIANKYMFSKWAVEDMLP